MIPESAPADRVRCSARFGSATFRVHLYHEDDSRDVVSARLIRLPAHLVRVTGAALYRILADVLPFVRGPLEEHRDRLGLPAQQLGRVHDVLTVADEDDARRIGIDVGPQAGADDADTDMRQVGLHAAAAGIVDLPPCVQTTANEHGEMDSIAERHRTQPLRPRQAKRAREQSAGARCWAALLKQFAELFNADVSITKNGA